MLVYVADKVQFLHDCESREIHSRDCVQNYSAKYVTEARKLRLIPA